MKRLLLFFSLFAILASPLQAAVEISGKIIPPAGQSAAGVNVVLLEQNPSKTPRGPIAMVKAGADGSYKLTLEEADPNSTYIVGSRIGENRGGSKPFHLSAGVSTKTVNVVLKAAPSANSAHGNKQAVVKGKFIVQGKITVPAGRSQQNISIVLVEIDMMQRRQNQVMMRKTDAQGRYKFELSEMNPGFKYQLGTKVGRQMVGSKMFAFKGTRDKVSADIMVAAVSEDTQNIVFTHMSTYLELGDGVMTITEFIDYSNLGNTVVDSFNKPLTKPIPAQAINFQAVAQGNVEINMKDGKVEIKALFPAGGNRVQYTYQVPISSGSFTLDIGVFEGTEQITLIRTTDAFKANFQDTIGNITETKQSHQQDTYYIQKLDGHKGGTVTVEIYGLATPQKELAYPATFLMIFLLTGLFWYLKVKPSQKKGNVKG